MHDPMTPIEQPIPAAPPPEGLPELGPSRLKNRRKRRPGLFVRRLLALGVFLGLIAGAGLGASMALNSLFPPAKLQVPGDPSARQNVLVIGVDPKPLPIEDNDKASRRLADTLMLFSLDPQTMRGFVLSLPRETKATLGEAGEGVLGDALAVGGIPLVKDTVEELTGLTIQHHVALDLDAARAIVGKIGGTDLYVGKPIKFNDKDAGLTLDLGQGWHALSPEQTLAYAYQRTEDELDRLERQQMLVRTWQERLHASWNWLWLMQLGSQAVGVVETDLPKRDFEYLVGEWRRVAPLNVTFGLLPGDANRRGEWLMSPRRWEALLPRLQSAPGGRSPAEIKPTVEVLYDDGADERVMMLANTLQNQGFQVIRTAHYPVDQDESVVTDRLRADERSQAILAAIDQAVGGARIEVSSEAGAGYAAQITVRLGKRFFK